MNESNRPDGFEPHRLLTTRSVANVLGLSESSVKRWADAGQINVARTPGGHRRITATEVVRFARSRELMVARPESIGLPPMAERAKGESHERWLREALMVGDKDTASRVLLGRFLAGDSIAKIADDYLAPALASIGDLWNQSDEGIVIEHRAIDICDSVLRRLQELIPAPPADAPLAVGAAPSGDSYILPSLIASMVFEECGWRAVNLGAEMPPRVLGTAAKTLRAKSAWVCFSAKREQTSADSAELRALATQLARNGGSLFCGGNNIPAEFAAGRITGLIPLADFVSLARHLTGK